MCGMDVHLNKLETLTLQTALRVPCQTNSQRWLILFKVHIHSVNNVLNQSYVKELFKPKPQCFLEPNQAVLSPKWQRSVLLLFWLAAMAMLFSVTMIYVVFGSRWQLTCDWLFRYDRQAYNSNTQANKFAVAYDYIELVSWSNWTDLHVTGNETLSLYSFIYLCIFTLDWQNS